MLLRSQAALNVEQLRELDQKRSKRFHYDANNVLELFHYWQGTLLPVVFGNYFFWFNIALFVAIVCVQRFV